MKRLLFFLTLLVILMAHLPCARGDDTLQPQVTKIDRGMQYLKFPKTKAKGMSFVVIDPQYYRLKILMASEIKLQQRLSSKQWAEKYHLIAAGNAGMYQEDHLTGVGLLKSGTHINNPRLGRDNSILAFDPESPTLPRLQIIDRKCQSFDDLRKNYRSLLQSIRMISCKQANTWKEGGEAWPILAVGTNREGKLIFAFSDTPLTPHDFIELTLSLPVNIYNLMYLEGGPPVQFYLKHKGTEINFTGTKALSPDSEGALALYLPIPNVLGIVPVK